LSFLVGVAALVLIWLLYPKDFDYTGAVADNVTYFQVRFPLPWAGSAVCQRSTARVCDAACAGEQVPAVTHGVHNVLVAYR
jgi:hypothetical protein